MSLKSRISCLVAVLGLREVIREHLVVLTEAVGIQLLDRARDHAVELLAPLQ